MTHHTPQWTLQRTTVPTSRSAQTLTCAHVNSRHTTLVTSESAQYSNTVYVHSAVKSRTSCVCSLFKLCCGHHPAWVCPCPPHTSSASVTSAVDSGCFLLFLNVEATWGWRLGHWLRVLLWGLRGFPRLFPRLSLLLFLCLCTFILQCCCYLDRYWHRFSRDGRVTHKCPSSKVTLCITPSFVWLAVIFQCFS